MSGQQPELTNGLVVANFRFIFLGPIDSHGWLTIRIAVTCLCLCVCAGCINLESALRFSGRGSYLGTGTSGVAAQSTPTSHNNSSGASANATSSNKTNLCRSVILQFLSIFSPLALN